LCVVVAIENRQDWVGFHANITGNEVKQMAAIAKTIPARQVGSGKNKTLDVVVYSGYAGLGIYDPTSMDHYGDLVEKYGVDWEVLSAAGLNVAMVGYGDHPILPILDAIAKGKNAFAGGNSSCPVVCGVISGTQADFAQRYNTCAARKVAKGVLWNTTANIRSPTTSASTFLAPSVTVIASRRVSPTSWIRRAQRQQLEPRMILASRRYCNRHPH
jgi:hypothetical protein